MDEDTQKDQIQSHKAKEVSNAEGEGGVSTVAGEASAEACAYTADVAPLSKKQQKKRLRYEKKMEIKKRRKLQDKEARYAKAKAQGRDIEKERKEMEERRLSGAGRKRRQDEWNSKASQASKSFQVCLDCSFSDQMTSKEIGSLSLQLRYCYSDNKNSASPCILSATSLEGATLQHLKNVSGFDDWSNRGFTCTEKSLEEHYSDNMSNVVYLTSDSDNTLEELDDTKIYVIGGIVDRNRLKRAAFDRAEKLGLATAKLPLDKHLKEMASTRVLTCNHVFSILLKCKESQNDWKAALLGVLPSRKDAKLAD